MYRQIGDIFAASCYVFTELSAIKRIHQTKLPLQQSSYEATRPISRSAASAMICALLTSS
jgi:hypothetical protein